MDLLKSILSRAIVMVAVLACSSVHARELDRYLLGPADLPSGCQRISELFPLNDKVAKFYEGKVYRSVVPAPVDRHAQSFDCDGQKGTLYFYEYQTINDKEQALLFARPVLTQTAGTPLVMDWSGGFVVLSFVQTPVVLQQRLQEKIGGGPAVPASAAIPVALSTTTSVVLSTAIPALSTTTAVIPSSWTPVALPVSPALSSPPTAPVPATASAGVAPSTPTLETPNDVSKDMLDKIHKSIHCRDRTLPAELTQVCDWMVAFRKGETVVPVIGSTDTRIGLGYRVDGDGQLEREYYQAAIGSGVAGEISLVPLYPANGVEEFELQAMVTASAEPRPLSSEMMQRVTSAPRPAGRTFIPTDGKSWLARRPNQTLYLRRSGKRWIILSLDNKTDESSEPEGFTITSFSIKK
jgi:hypothetical protein